MKLLEESPKESFIPPLSDFKDISYEVIVYIYLLFFLIEFHQGPFFFFLNKFLISFEGGRLYLV